MRMFFSPIVCHCGEWEGGRESLGGGGLLECDRGIPDALRQTNNYNKIPAKQGTVSERRKHLFITSGVSGHRGDYVEKQAGLEGERVWRVPCRRHVPDDLFKQTRRPLACETMARHRFQSCHTHTLSCSPGAFYGAER